MPGRGMGAATQGGGAVRSGPRNKVLKTRSKTTGIPMYAEGGEVDVKVTRGQGKTTEAQRAKAAAAAKVVTTMKAARGQGKFTEAQRAKAVAAAKAKKAKAKKAKPVKKNRGGMMYR
jgi:hypothetical protein